jgi:hypothetical protein
LTVSTPSLLHSGGGILLDPAILIEPNPPTTLASCPKWDTDLNGSANVYLNRLIRLVQYVIQVARGMTSATIDNRRLLDVVNEHDSNVTFFNYVPECPGGSEIERKLQLHESLIREGKAAAIAAMNVLLGSATGALGELQSSYFQVCAQRRLFDATGSGGLTELNRKHDEFLGKLQRCGNYKIFAIQIDGKIYDPSSYYTDVRAVTDVEKHCSAIDELDRLRDEYASRSRPVPRRDEFTQSRESAHFRFAELNDGDYNWALITDRLLASLEAARTHVGSKTLNVTSGYRNPVRNDQLPGSAPNSRHQYGDAADITPSDLNEDGNADSLDRDLLYTAALSAGFNEVIKKNIITVHMAHE